MRHFILAASLALTLGSAQAAEATLDLKVRDLSADFVDFYDQASKPLPPVVAPTAGQPAPVQESLEDRRWRLFKKHYDFSAQSTPEAARTALDGAWSRYAGVLPQIEAGFDGIAAESSQAIGSLSKLQGLTQSMSLRLVAYVGAFEGRVWRDKEEDVVNLYLPLEVGADARQVPMARLIGETMLDKTAGWGSKPRTLAELVVGEGVVAHGAAAVAPGKGIEQYLGINADELARLRANRKTILSTMLPKLGDGSAVTLDNYRGAQLAEARFAGWLLVEGFAKKKARYADMIRQKPADLTKVSQATMASINRAK